LEAMGKPKKRMTRTKITIRVRIKKGRWVSER
jgi:hypothetical protein